MIEIIEDIKAKRILRDKLLDEIEIWAKIMEQGIEILQVEAFGWDNKLVPAHDMKRASAFNEIFYPIKLKEEFPWYGKWLGISGKPLWYNYVVMRDGTRKPLKPYIKAV